MEKKSWIVFGLLIAAMVGGMFYVQHQNKSELGEFANKEKVAKFIEASEENGQISDHIIGKKDAKVVLVEYSDYQCPYCAKWAPEAHKVAEKYKDYIAFIPRAFPLTMHPNARPAAAAAEAAGLQGKFHEMDQLLYKKQEEWSGTAATSRNKLFYKYAESLKLDIEKFKTDMASDAVAKKIAFDLSIGEVQKVQGTPSFFINGEPVEMAGDNPIEDAVLEALKDAGVEVKIKEEVKKPAKD